MSAYQDYAAFGVVFDNWIKWYIYSSFFILKKMEILILYLQNKKNKGSF